MPPGTLPDPPTFADVLRARRTIRPHLPRTPLFNYPALDAVAGTEVWVKHENHQPVGAFKVRGGVNLVANLSEEEREAGVICASTGNHGQSVAWSARRFGVHAVVGVPEGANPAKVESMRALGADIVVRGADFDAARVHVEELAASEGYRYIHSGNEPHLIAGVATATLEVLEDEPGIETLVVPVGGGSGASGAGLVAKTLRPEIEVVGVQSAQAPAAYRSWKEGRPVEAATGTFAEGLATRVPFALPQAMMRKHLDDFVLVDDEAMREAIRTLLKRTRNLAEGAGAAAYAAVASDPARFAGRKTAVILSGGNLSLDQLRQIVAAETVRS